MKLQETEDHALNNCARLLKFAAEHRRQKDLPDSVVSTITHSWELRENGRWDPDAAKSFWMAYSSLCDLIQPATVDTIESNSPRVTTWRWFPFGARIKTCLSRRFAHLCMGTLLFLLLLALVSGYLASSADSLSREVQMLRADADKNALQVRADIDGVKSDIERLMTDDKTKGNFDAQKGAFEQDLINIAFPAETALKISQLREHLQNLYYYTDTMYQKVKAISAITRLKGFDDYVKGDLTPVPILQHALANLTAYYLNRRDMNDTLQRAWILTTIYNAFVPMLLGALGACTYVLRLISDEIRETTFSSTSPVRNVMRIALGALAGVIIGFGGIVTGTGLSSAALSFIAGYAVEPVFSTLDGIAERFREARKPATPT